MYVAARAKSVNNPARIGVFGGTFDPLHLGHLAIARTAWEQARLDKVLFVLAANPPHKPEQSITSAEDRVAMAAAALEEEPGFELSRIELDREGLSYTADTLKQLQDAMPGAQLFFIVGYDSALDLPKWRSPADILKRARLLIAPRPQNSHSLSPLLDGHYDMLAMPESPLSSSDIRARLQRGEMPANALPRGVARIIREKGLYQSCP